MSFEYRARITVTTNMAGNGGEFSKSFDGYCTVGLNTRAKGTNSIAKRAEAYLQAVNVSNKPPPKVSSQQASGPALPQLRAVSRIGAIPIVGKSISSGERIYYRIRECNPLIRWYLSTVESSVKKGASYARPAVCRLEQPLLKLDQLVCRSLDAVERSPTVRELPEKIISDTRRYMMRRADSVKQLGSAVLDSRVTAVTAGALDRAITTADRYVDRILPPDNQDVVDGPEQAEGDGTESGRARAVQTIEHGARLRRKLQRRLTRQALAEAKAIKEQIHVLAYIAELVVTDPVLAWRKTRELYAALSQPEPENQARPDTVEQMFVMLARESARRVVHLINFTANDLPRTVKGGMSVATSHMLSAAQALYKTARIDVATNAASNELEGLTMRLSALLQSLRSSSKTYLEQLAVFLAGNEEREKLPPRTVESAANSVNGIN